MSAVQGRSAVGREHETQGGPLARKPCRPCARGSYKARTRCHVAAFFALSAVSLSSKFPRGASLPGVPARGFGRSASPSFSHVVCDVKMAGETSSAPPRDALEVENSAAPFESLRRTASHERDPPCRCYFYFPPPRVDCLPVRLFFAARHPRGLLKNRFQVVLRAGKKADPQGGEIWSPLGPWMFWSCFYVRARADCVVRWLLLDGDGESLLCAGRSGVGSFWEHGGFFLGSKKNNTGRGLEEMEAERKGRMQTETKQPLKSREKF